MKKLLVLLAIVILAGCGASAGSRGGGDGTSVERPVMVDASSEREGLKAENAWIVRTYPGAKKTGQALKGSNDRMIDEITIETADGKTREVYFDITSFFGKF